MSLDDAYDYSDFLERVERAGSLREGYWSPFSVLVWIASRDRKMVAASQMFEQEMYANRGGLHSSAAWFTLGNAMGGMFGITLTQASEQLREALETGRISGGVATVASSGSLRQIERHEWTQWKLAFEHFGLSLLYGLHDFKWPSEIVMAAFPETVDMPPAYEASQKRPVEKAEIERWYRERIQFALTNGIKFSRDQDEKEARAVLGIGRERVRALRRQFAPSDWQEGGRPGE